MAEPYEKIETTPYSLVRSPELLKTWCCRLFICGIIIVIIGIAMLIYWAVSEEKLIDIVYWGMSIYPLSFRWFASVLYLLQAGLISIGGLLVIVGSAFIFSPHILEELSEFRGKELKRKIFLLGKIILAISCCFIFILAIIAGTLGGLSLIYWISTFDGSVVIKQIAGEMFWLAVVLILPVIVIGLIIAWWFPTE